MTALAPAPQGFSYVRNRTTQVYEDMFDGKPYVFQPGEVRLLPDDQSNNPVATYLCDHSVKQLDMLMNRGERALVKQGDAKWDEEFDTRDLIEVVDRSSGDNPIGAGTGGVKTHAAVIRPRGQRLTRASIPS